MDSTCLTSHKYILYFTVSMLSMNRSWRQGADKAQQLFAEQQFSYQAKRHGALS